MKRFALLLALLALSFDLPIPLYAGVPVKVGIYQNRPVAFMDTDGKARGIYIDILEYIASKEGWSLEYVPGSWAECLQRLGTGEIDLQVGIAYSEARSERFDFTNVTVLSNWAQLYTARDSKIQSILDLQNKNIAVVRGDIYYTEFKSTVESFGINCNFVEVDESLSVFELMDKRVADAGLISRLFGLQHEKGYDVERSTVVCCPQELRFAVPGDKNPYMIQAIDNHLLSLKKDTGSIYFQSLARWIGDEKEVVFPGWVGWVLVSCMALFVVFLAMSVILRSRVKARTAELSFRSEELQAEIAQRKRAEETLKEVEEKFRTICASAQDAILMMGNEGRISYWNEAATKIFGHSSQEALGQELHTFLCPQRFHEASQKGFAGFQNTGEGPVIGKTLELTAARKDGTEFPIELSVSAVELKGKWHAIGILRDITERKRVEKRLRKINRMLEMLSECNQTLVRETDETGLMEEVCRNIVEVGRYPLAWIGFAEHDREKTVRPAAQWGYDEGYLDMVNITWADSERGRGPTGKAIRTGKPSVVRHLLTDPHYEPYRAEATKRGYQSSIALPLLADGQCLGVLNIYAGAPDAFDTEEIELLTDLADDLSYGIMALRTRVEHKRAEQALREAHARLQHVLDSSPTVVYSCNVPLNGNPEEGYAPTFVTANITDILGYDVEEYIGNPKWWPEHIHPDDAPAAFTDMQRLFQEGHLVHEYRFQAKDESWRWVHDELILVRDAEGKPVEFVGSWMDITDRKRMEEALRKSEGRLKDMVERLPEGVCLLDRERRVILSNPIAQEYLQLLGPVSAGESVSSLGGKPLEDFLTPSPNGRAHEVTVEEPACRVFEIEANPIREEEADGGWVLVVREMTQEREVQERVRQQDRLAAVGQLAAGIAHDFNNLLTVIIGTAQIIEMRQDVPDAIKEELRTIFVQGQRAAQMVRQVLDFSRQTTAERKPVDLAPFLKEVVKLMERTLPESIKIVTEFAAGEHIVNANLTQLQQVLTNLAINARDAMREGGELRIGLSRLRLEPGEQPPIPRGMAPGDWVVWTISDTGTGMPPETMAHIFEPFFTTKQRVGGTGLGSAQVYGIVKQHNGFIEMESEVGNGTTFTIYLPQITEKEGPVERASTDMTRGQGKTILVVEDKPEVLKVARGILEGLGYQVVTASNGKEALEVYDRHRGEIALVLTDMVMPEMGGATLVEALKKRDPEVRIVVMTGYAGGEEEGVQLPSGMVGYLDKPLDLRQVAQVVDQALKSKKPNET